MERPRTQDRRWRIAADLRTEGQARAANVTEQSILWMGACLEAAWLAIHAEETRHETRH